MHMYTFAEGQSAHKMIKKLADIMTIIQVSPVSKEYHIQSWTFINLCKQHYKASCRFEIFYDVDSKIVIYPNTGFIGFVVETFQGLHAHLESNHWYQWFLVLQTIGSDGFSMVFPL